MKVLVIMWVLFLGDLSSEKRVYVGTLNECLLNTIMYNDQYRGKRHAGCYMEVVKYDFVPRD